MPHDEYFGRIEEDEAEARFIEAASGPDTDVDSGPATLTLAEIERRTGISYVTLIRYARDHRDRLPSEGEGIKRRYYPAAVEEFVKIKEEIAARRQDPKPAAVRSATSVPPIRGRKKRAAAKKSAPKTPAKKRPAAVRPAPLLCVGKPSKIETGASTSLAPELDHMAHVYQLKIQRKALDDVLALIVEWQAKISAEIRELEK